MNIKGMRRDLSLFAPEINPMLLVRAKAAGLSIEDVLNSISGNLPPYRFIYLLEKAKQLAGTLQSLGSTLLSALEKKDVEELARIRATHQQNIFKLTTQVKKYEINAAEEVLQSSKQRRIAIENRKNHFDGLIDQGLTSCETAQVIAKHVATVTQGLSSIFFGSAPILFLLPQLGSPFAIKYGGKEMGDSAKAWGELLNTIASISESVSSSAGLVAGFERREEDWEYQKKLAEDELTQVDKDITATEIRRDIAQKSLDIHRKEMEQLKEIDDFYQDKFSNFGLYTWLSTTLQRSYREAYNNAYSMAKLAEQAFHFECGHTTENFLQGNYWDASKAGLLAGEKLLVDLQNLERRFIETNYRALEINQSFSLMQINPVALLELKATGTCEFTIPELFFDLYYPGHYRRQIKSARLTLPCVTGPYTNVSATLTLQRSQLRIEPKLENTYLKDVPLTRTVSIATSNAQNDAGVFELNFRDERYMPFEGAGAISTWQLSLPKNFRPFNYDTISDVVLHLSYTAEQDGLLRETVESMNGEHEGRLQAFLQENNLPRIFSVKHEFPTEWHQFVNGTEDLAITIKKSHFPFFVQGKTIALTKLELYTIQHEQLSPPVTLTELNKTNLSNHLNQEDECSLSIPAVLEDEASGIVRDKQSQVFMVFHYSLSSKQA
jgi:hypothetical protein